MKPGDSDDRLRLVRHWQPGAWVGALRKAFGPTAEIDDEHADTFEHRPAQWLSVLWRPQSPDQPFLGRWPAMVQLTDLDGPKAVAALLAQVPAPAPLWVAQHEIDWALMAEIVLLTEADLAPWQHRELAQFIVDERKATAQTIAMHYAEDDDGFADTRPNY